MDSIGKCEGLKSFRQSRTRIRETTILYSPELLPVLDADARLSGPSTTADAVAVWEKAIGRLYSPLFLATSESAQLIVRAHKGRGTRPMGDGAEAWNALNERFDAQNQEARRACHNEQFDLRPKAGGDPINFFT